MTSDRVREVRARFHELLLGPHRASTCAMVASLTDGNRTLSPHVVERRVYDAAREAAEVVSRALVIASERLVADADLRRKLGLGVHVDTMLDLDREQGERPLVTRLDGFIGADGLIRFIENNGYDPRGSPGFQQAHAALPIYTELASAFPLTPVTPYPGAVEAVTARQLRRGLSPIPTIAIIERTDRTEIEGPWLPSVAATAGWTMLPATAADFTYEGGVLRVRGTAIDFVDVDSRVLFEGEASALSHVFAAVRDGAARFPFGIARGMLVDHKSMFEVLSSSEYEHIFDTETNRRLRAHVPWTRVLRARKTLYEGRVIDLLPFVAENRDRFVIKPCAASSGDGVVVGRSATESAWLRALKIARAVTCVVQERVDIGLSDTYYFVDMASGEIDSGSFTADLDPFVWDGQRADGALSRISRNDIHNTGSGAWLAPIWVLEH